ncbi:MAG: hypothetical protein ACTHKL_25725 [Streptosporangiaceae bacterium]
MIRFGVVLSVVVIAIGLLVTGVVAGSLLLVVISIGVALLAFLLLIGVVISFRHEIFGRTPLDAAGAQVSPQVLAGRGTKAASSPHGEPVMAASRLGVDPPGRAVRVPPAQPAERGARERQGRPPVDAGEHDRGQPPARPAAKPAATTHAGDRGQQAAAARTKAQQAQFAKAPRNAAPTPATPSVERAHDEQAERESAQRDRARSEQPAARQASGASGAADLESSDRERLANQHGARRLDRPSAEQQGEHGQAEPRRASRLERESARAAGSRVAGAGPAASHGTSGAAPAKPESSRPAPSKAAAAGAAATSAGVPAKPAEPATDEVAGVRSGDQPGTGTAGKPDAHGPDAAAPSEQPATAEPAQGQPATVSEPTTGGQTDGAAEGPARTDDDEMRVSVVPGITRYHRSDCLLIRFLSADDLEVMTKTAASEAGCVPCKACKPDQAATDATTS